jgi:hypothetical protein
MRDRDIRQVLHAELALRFGDDPETLVLDELGLLRGAFRIDLAVVNGVLHGYEIKSEQDTLTRLPAQAVAYSAVFDEVTVVIGNRHISMIEALVPEWWSIVVATAAGRDSVVLEETRGGGRNPSPDAYSIAQLLWKDEALAALETLGLERGLRSKPRPVLSRTLADAMPLDELRETVRRRLRLRLDWRAPA